jgi:hypothetical protein
VPELEQHSTNGDSPFVGLVWFVVTLFSLVPAKGAAQGWAASICEICGYNPLHFRALSCICGGIFGLTIGRWAAEPLWDGQTYVLTFVPSTFCLTAV